MLWVLEDSPQQAVQIQRALSATYEVRLFQDGGSILEALSAAEYPPDALVLDWHVPDISGLEVLRVVRQQLDEVTLPVLILTSSGGDSESPVQVLAAGANDYATKPFVAAELHARVSTLVRIRNLHDRARRAERELTYALQRENAARADAVAEGLKASGSERRLRSVTDALPVLVAFVNSDECYGYVNRGYEDWFGLTAESLLGRKVREVIGEPAYAVLGPFVRRGLAGERFTFEQHDVPYRLGGKRDIRVTFIPLDLGREGGGGYVSLIQDITSQRAMQLERERLAAQRTQTLERQAQFEQHLIGIVSHDLRTPLQVILMFSELLVEDDSLAPAAAKKIARVRNAALRATRMVSDLLDFTQARLGNGIPVSPRPTNVHQLLDTLVMDIEAAFPERRIECAHAGRGEGVWDPERIAQMAQNLITNAIKYSPPESVVRVSSREHQDAVELRVHNEGAPIPVESQAHLFEPLQRGEGTLDRATRSIGMGLYIVKQIVQAHGGTVAVTSEVQSGTTFVVTLPFLSAG